MAVLAVFRKADTGSRKDSSAVLVRSTIVPIYSCESAPVNAATAFEEYRFLPTLQYTLPQRRFMKSFFAELQRRDVYKVAAAWLLIQIATQVFPFFEVPN